MLGTIVQAINPKRPGRPPLGELSLPFDDYDDIETYLCKNGHEVTRENYRVRTRSDGRSYKSCLICERKTSREQYYRDTEKIRERQNARYRRSVLSTDKGK